ncbi:MAG TPA: hypothetical protein VIM38_10660 [Alphaproteobacteria bacterium]|jgi:hypothetical protein
MRLSLEWRGPLRAGALPAAADAIAALDIAAVYLRVKRYANGRVIAYVGQSRHLIARIDQHIAQLLALQSAVRDETGEPRLSGSAIERFDGLNRLDETLALVKGELDRLSFYYAPCAEPDALGVLEHLLKTRIEERAASLSLFGCENRNAISFACEESVAAANILDALAPADRDLVASLLGDEALVAELVADGA